MITIPISGVIATFELEGESNVTPGTLRKSLDDAGGEDILVTINSPGGGVFAGLEMFSLLKNYSGNVETRIVSLAASMGSVLALAGDKKTAENTALYYIHNAHGAAYGDYRDLAKESDFLKQVTDLIANLYTENTHLTLKEIYELMDAETSFFGSDLELLGFEIVDTGEKTTDTQARIRAGLKIARIDEKLKNENYAADIEKVAAFMTGAKNRGRVAAAATPQKISRAQLPANNAGKNKTEEKTMTLEKLMAENPAAKIEMENLLNEKFEAGKFEAAKEYENRIAAASKFLDSEEYPKQIKDVAVNVIKGENSLETLNTMVASVDMFREMNKSAAAQAETAETGETPGEQPPKLSGTGEIKSIDDYFAEVARAKQSSGVEVR